MNSRNCVKILGICYCDKNGKNYRLCVENRLYEDEKSIDLIKSKLKIAKDNNAKRIILGCTHYPYLLDIFKNILDVNGRARKGPLH